MCFSAEMDAVAGVVVTGIGIDALRHVKRREQVALAALPLLFGLHQGIETFVWLGLEGHVGQALEDAATWVYLLIACVIVPVAVPWAFWRLGTSRWPRLDPVFLAAGLFAAVVDAWALGVRAVPHVIDGHQITYRLGVWEPNVSVSLYVIAACAPALVARSRPLQLFGLLNLVVVSGLALLNQNGVISLWCVWAAITSVLINLHLRGRLARTRVGSHEDTHEMEDAR